MAEFKDPIPTSTGLTGIAAFENDPDCWFTAFGGEVTGPAIIVILHGQVGFTPKDGNNTKGGVIDGPLVGVRIYVPENIQFTQNKTGFVSGFRLYKVKPPGSP